ncbi:teichoic acid transporter [Acidianus sulfidivorans JP7]|uniref:Teichoic acid transporter n=1 Tax=Acidianus sulfidivorans JP7 TaxID=619593 RepID=A0A2U9INC9_9CREN|nr:teichoic acid transporter [Acidianus sulfidivorans]AWR97521.1 teichoic acid transporter [Acidianus sulfidivorans JP7]
MENKSKEKNKTPGFVRIGLFNLLLKTSVAPISFLFSLLVVRYLSSISIETFGIWQYIFILVTGYFTIPGDLFSSITSRYSAEGKSVGGIIIINGIAGALSSLIYFFLIPVFVNISKYYVFSYFYLAILLIISIYLMKISNSIALAKSPRVTAISTVVFQLLRLGAGILLMFYYHLSIEAVILAYTIGYISQILFNLVFTNANLKIDFKVAFTAIRKSLVFIMNYIQLIIESTLTLIIVALVGSAIPVSYFESALIISNIIYWSQASTDGLILKLQESKDQKLIEIALELFFTLGGIFLLIIFVDGERLLYILRPDYIASIWALLVLSASNFVRALYSIFYRAIYMKDDTLAVESKGEFKGYTAKLTRNNVIISIFGVSSMVLLAYVVKNTSSNINVLAPLLAVIISSALLINSIGMLVSSFRISKELYNFKFPKAVAIISILLAIISSLPFIGLNKERTIPELEKMTELTLASIAIYVVLSYLFNPYARQLIKSGIKRLI